MIQPGSSIKKILLIALHALGDVVLLTSTIYNLKEQFAQAEIHLLIREGQQDILAHNPYITAVLTLDKKGLALTSFKGRMDYYRSLVGKIRREGFDLAIDAFSGSTSAILSFLSGASMRLGEDRRDRLRGYLYNIRVTIPVDIKHVMDRTLYLLHGLGIQMEDCLPELYVSTEERKEAKRLLSDLGYEDNHKLVGMFPDAGWYKKCWPLERLAEVSDQLYKEKGTSTLFLCENRAILDEVVALTRHRPYLVSTKGNLRRLCALISLCDVFVSNDSAPMHIAAALGIQTIGLFGTMPPVMYAPRGKKTQVIYKGLPCSPCPQLEEHCIGRKCMEAITVDDVWQAIEKYEC